MKANEELEVPSDERLSIGYFSSNGLSRSNSAQNINLLAEDPASQLMQKRIDDLEIGFKQLDRRTDDVDYDIETLETVTGKMRICYDDLHEDIQLVRDEMMDLFDRLDAVDADMKARNKKQRPTRFDSSLYRSSYMGMGSRQTLTRASQSDLRGSSYSLDKPYTARPVFSPVMSPKQRRSMSPQHSPDRSPQPTPPRSPVSRSPVSRSLVSRSPVSRSPMSSPPLSPARSKENVYDDDIDYESDLGSDY